MNEGKRKMKERVESIEEEREKRERTEVLDHKSFKYRERIEYRKVICCR